MNRAKPLLLSLVTCWLILVSQLSYARHAAILIDASNGNVLYELEANQSWYPASLTKLMTLYMTFEALESGRLRLNSHLEVSNHAARQPTSKLGLRSWDTISVEDAIIAIITRSANDAAVVLAEGIASTERNFAVKMTSTAHRLGMYGSHFMNATGLPHDWQTTTAHDMGLLAMRIVRDFPQYYGYFGMDSMYFNGRDLHGINKFVTHYPGAEGMKTGYTCGSGYNLVASANQFGKRLIGVVLGGMTSSERYEHMFMMMDMGFSNPYTYRSKNINTMSKNPVGIPPYQLSCGHRPTSHYAARSYDKDDDDNDDRQIRYVKKYTHKPLFTEPKKPIEKIKVVDRPRLIEPKAKVIVKAPQKPTIAYAHAGKKVVTHESKPIHVAENRSSKAGKIKTKEPTATAAKTTKQHDSHKVIAANNKGKTAKSAATSGKTKGYYVPSAKDTAKTVKTSKKGFFKPESASKTATKVSQKANPARRKNHK